MFEDNDFDSCLEELRRIGIAYRVEESLNHKPNLIERIICYIKLKKLKSLLEN